MQECFTHVSVPVDDKALWDTRVTAVEVVIYVEDDGGFPSPLREDIIIRVNPVRGIRLDAVDRDRERGEIICIISIMDCL